jgi:tetratricopeptide (TPR) repeat protein
MRLRAGSLGSSGRIGGAGVLAASLAVILAGCQKPEPPRAEALARYEEAEAKFAAKDLAAAREAFAAAVTLGGLRPDLHAEAELRLAYCEACLGNHEAAINRLDSLEEAAPNPAEVCAMRTLVLRKAGDTAGAEAAWVRARQWDPAVSLPREP